ncbi:hypothetical protein BJF92_12015 [Rhizobium rhizosphaerae]|uniref:Uncharacterized protein n=1 Tax=Xaviernesmea rhizosphaerae TaxID=1672749 RepID=A0A1Q9AN24_9HYPH|nr:hypothetical protein [Xaviernesmea rhizosphaerae]OLP56791.1 hypothetical protein BJF92_12015 [Xaviernesmea rhizosphaerae]
MADLPVPFTGAMVRALIEGRKRQTRRTIKRLRGGAAFCRIADLWPAPAVLDYRFEDANGVWHDINKDELLDRLPYRVGDRLWVKEKYLPDPPANDPSWDDHTCTYVEWSGCGSKVSDIPPALRLPDHVLYATNPSFFGYQMRWRPGMHMPRWASRITLIVTEVRVERLQAIREADAIAEGIEPHKSGWMPYATMFYESDGVTPANYHVDPRISYMQLWESINGPRSWDENPMVAVYTFAPPILANIDSLPGAAP